MTESWSPEDHLRHYMYQDIYRALRREFPRPPSREWSVLDFGSKWYGDPDGGWRTHMRTMLKTLLGTSMRHTLATYPEYDIEKLPLSMSSVDFLIADQVLEHVERPWRAALEIARVVGPFGLCMIATPGLYPVHPSPKDCWRIMPHGYDVLFPTTLWTGVTGGAWGTAGRVGFEYSVNGAFPDGPPQTPVELARRQGLYEDEYDGRCPLMLWFVGRRTHAPTPEAL